MVNMIQTMFLRFGVDTYFNPTLCPQFLFGPIPFQQDNVTMYKTINIEKRFSH